MNIFLGARRLAWMGAFLIFGWLTWSVIDEGAYMSLSQVNVTYSTQGPKEALTLTDDECPNSAIKHFVDGGTHKNRYIRVKLCFLPKDFGEGYGSLFISDEIEKGYVTGPKDAGHVLRYVEKRVSEFSVPPADLERIHEIGNEVRNGLLTIYGLMVAIALGGYAALVFFVGWIVRGFMGIPRGMDKRPD